MITRLTTVDELQSIFSELLINHTNKVTKVSPLSVNSGIGYGIGKIGQRIIKDIALLETQNSVDDAYGEYLDLIAERRGVAGRFLSSQSSTYVRVVGAVGTQYVQGTQTFTSSNGIIFDVEETFTIPQDGFGYVKVRSQSSGSNTNISPLSINKVTPVPTGHTYCVNEFSATGGGDLEDDDSFRKRIKEGANILAKQTESALAQLFMSINNNVFDCFYNGVDSNGKSRIVVISQNGVDFTTNEFNEMLTNSKKYFNLNNLDSFGLKTYNIVLENPTWKPIDISQRVKLYDGVNPDDFRKECQIRIAKFLDYRYFNQSSVKWVDIFSIIENTPGCKDILDNYATPNQDIIIEYGKLPRVRGFLLLNIDGTLLSDTNSILDPIFYPQNPDFSYQKTVYKSLNNG